VTVGRLLSHTAGLPAPIPLRWIHPASRHGSFDEREALRRVIERHGRLASEPGTKYRYSNLGYWLLGPVVEKAAGEPFEQFVRREILEPIGLTPDQLGYAITDPGRHATGYLEKYSVLNVLKRWFVDREYLDGYDGRWLRIRAHYLNGAAFGGLVGTASGVGVFLQDQLRSVSKILPPRARALFYDRQRTVAGDPVPMTLGWHVRDKASERYYFKEGGGGGFHSMMRLYPDRRVASVIMTNATGFDVARALDQADREFFQ
jgi:D-alanyl-D-alanine carboxypeptidase